MFYSIIADKVSDISNKEQLSLSFRYVCDGSIKEVFGDFVKVERITGENIAEAILTSLGARDLPLQNHRG